MLQIYYNNNQFDLLLVFFIFILPKVYTETTVLEHVFFVNVYRLVEIIKGRKRSKVIQKIRFYLFSRKGNQFKSQAERG
jgi:hypothetical protein